jgi:hypothetical protein
VESHQQQIATTSRQTRRRLMELVEERVWAECIGMSADCRYVRELEEEIAGHRAALLGARVTEIATLHGLINGRNFG